MEIYEIALFQVPIELESLDRWTNDTYLKYQKNDYTRSPFYIDKYKPNTNKFSWEILSTTKAKFIITESESEDAKYEVNQKPNYIMLRSDLFFNVSDNNETSPKEHGYVNKSYWFLNKINSVESGNAFEYVATLDVFATFGDDFLHNLRNQEILIKRWHENRYYVSANSDQTFSAYLNVNNIGLINSDFKLGNTLGQEKTYQKALVQDQSNSLYVFRHGTTPINLGIVNNEVIDDEGNSWYKYGIITLSGEPFNVWKGKGIPPQILSWEIGNQVLFLKDGKGVGIDNVKAIIPIGSGVTEPNDEVIKLNTLAEINNLPQGKMISYFLSPVKLFAKNIDINYNLFPISNIDTFEELKKLTREDIIAKVKKFQDTFPLQKDYFIFGGFANDFKPPIKEIDPPNWDDKIIHKTANLSLQEMINFLSEENSEIGIFHPSISPLTFHTKLNDDYKPIIDIYNFINNPHVKIKVSFDGQGLFTDINIADYQFATFDAKTQMNIVSNSGMNYLNNNRYQIEAQKEGAKLQAQLQNKQLQTQQNSTYGGGLISGLLSLANPVNYVSNVFEGEQMNITSNIASNSINKINSAIQDATSQAPNYHEGSGNSFKLVSTQQLKGIFNYELIMPNKFLKKSIINHYERFGYNTNRWVKLTNKGNWWKTREYFNFLQIENVEQYFQVYEEIDETRKLFLNIDNDVLKMFSSLLSKGVRLWNTDDVGNYSQYNIEKFDI